MLMTKFIGKPYAGKPHVRFEEGTPKQIYFIFALGSTLPGEKMFDCSMVRWLDGSIVLWLKANSEGQKANSFVSGKWKSLWLNGLWLNGLMVKWLKANS